MIDRACVEDSAVFLPFTRDAGGRIRDRFRVILCCAVELERCKLLIDSVKSYVNIGTGLNYFQWQSYGCP